MTPLEIAILKEIQTIKRPQWVSGFLPKFGLNKRLCEIGVRKGSNLFRLLRAKPELMVAVDIWKDDGDIGHNDIGFAQVELDRQYASILDATKKYPALQVLRMYSHEAAALFADGLFDYVYLDADHTYKAVKQDIAAWYPKVRSGGLLAGHD